MTLPTIFTTFSYCSSHKLLAVCIWFLLLSGVLFTTRDVSGQQFIQFLSIAPDISVNIKLNEHYTINSKVEAFQLFLERDDADSPLWINKFEGADLQLFITRRLNPFSRASLGYQYGFEPGDPGSHRFIQQYLQVSRFRNLTFGQRLRSDQTFTTDKATKLRLRSRISFEIPLQGQSLDPMEFFLLVSDEILYAYQKPSHSLENRFVLNAGYMINPSQKLQFGFDLRSENGQLITNNTLLVKLGWIVNM
jgi:hypothetical protein